MAALRRSPTRSGGYFGTRHRSTASRRVPQAPFLLLRKRERNFGLFSYNRTDPLLHGESNGYDLNGNLTRFTDRKSQATNYRYDGLNRLTQVTFADQSTVTYTWYAGNRLNQVVDSLNGTITRSYDGLDRLLSESTPQGSVSYTYDGAGRRLTMSATGQAAFPTPTTTPIA